MAARPVSDFLADTLDGLAFANRGCASLRIHAFGDAARKNSRLADEEGFYESILPPELLALELSDRDQKEILTEIAKNHSRPA